MIWATARDGAMQLAKSDDVGSIPHRVAWSFKKGIFWVEVKNALVLLLHTFKTECRNVKRYAF